jgi:outer membrane protein assembly factor BamB
LWKRDFESIERGYTAGDGETLSEMMKAMMRKTGARWAPVLVGLALAGGSWAQFDGPAPLAWRWAASTSVRPFGSPATDANGVYVAVGNRVFGLERGLGTQRWRYPVGEPIPGTFRNGLTMAPDGTIVAAADNRTIYALDSATGREKWTYVAPDPLIGAPVVAGGFVVFQATGTTLMALNLSDGQPAWSNPYRVASGVMGSLSAFQNIVIFFGQDLVMTGLDAGTQRPAYQVRFASLDPNVRAVVAGDSMYVTTGTRVASLGANNGRRRWEQDVFQPLVFWPAVSSELVAAVSRDGRLFVLDTSGRFVNRRGIDLKSGPVTAPSFVGRLLSAPTANGSLNVVDPKSGDEVWNYIVRPMSGAPANPQPGEPAYVQAAGPAVVSGSSLFLLAQDGSLLAFDRETGVDLTPPAVRLLFPNPGEQVSGQPPLQLVFRITDEASGLRLDSVKVEIDGKAMAHEVTREGICVVRITAAGANRPLTDGRKAIVVTATDWLGNTTSQSFALTIDNTLRPIALPSGGGGESGGGGGGR